MKNYMERLSVELFHELTGDEELSLGLHSEESEFVRFNQSKVRQNTSLQQHELNLKFQKEHRSYTSTSTLTLNFKQDAEMLKTLLTQLREDLMQTDENPKFIKMVNNGTSEVYKKSQRPTTPSVIKKISEQFSDSDLAGYYCAGPIRKASVNSTGQFHYFENDQFFLDYSIYDGPRAAKGFYSEEKWSDSDFTNQALQLKNTLSMLKKPLVKVKPGAYKTYLAPMAVGEIAQLFNWRAVSRSAYEQGFTPLKKLFTQEASFSPLFSLSENNELGLNSHFNYIGEVSPQYLPVIENGELKNFLISKPTAKEYGLISNNPNEVLYSMEIRAGTLDEKEVLNQLGTGLYLTNLHYINWSDPQAARITGMTRFACFWVENGEIVGPIQDLRFDDTLYNLFGSQLINLTQAASTFVDTSTYQKRSLGGMKVPGILLNKMNFTL